MSVAIHTAARRYCIERHAHWADRYAEIVRRRGDRERDGYNYTPEALSTFPRYNVLNAILVELERIDPEQLGELSAAKTRLLHVGETANDDFTLTPIEAIDERATAEERAAFCSYLGDLSPVDLGSVEALPFRCLAHG
jgi:hypothetical protein